MIEKVTMAKEKGYEQKLATVGKAYLGKIDECIVVEEGKAKPLRRERNQGPHVLDKVPR